MIKLTKSVELYILSVSKSTKSYMKSETLNVERRNSEYRRVKRLSVKYFNIFRGVVHSFVRTFYF